MPAVYGHILGGEAMKAIRMALMKKMFGGSGGDGTVKNQHKTITENGVYRADSGYTGLGTVTVSVPEKVPILQEKTVTENGEVVADSGYDGLSKVTVNVAQTGGGSTGGDTENWLFKNEYFAPSRLDLPELTDGVSYTCFVDGVELDTQTFDAAEGVCIFNGSIPRGDVIPMFIKMPNGTGWMLDSGGGGCIESANISIRING